MKQIPNIFTLLNLVFGCLAIVMILQTGESILVLDNFGNSTVFLPEKLWAGSLFIFAAAVIDFLDGFLARLMKAHSAMGAQLDSLSDVVSFGVAPGMILYQLLRMSYAQDVNGLDVSIIALLPAFVFTVAVAWRLAKFNLITTPSASFVGVPSPAAGLLIASFPLIIHFSQLSAGPLLPPAIATLFINKWLLYGVILVLSYLMLSRFSFISLKFKSFGFKENAPQYILLLLSLIAIIVLRWAAAPVIFILYLIVSFTAPKNATFAPKY